MAHLDTAKRHFDEDMTRSRALIDHGNAQQPSALQSDIFRAGWMMAVGASDAYFSDAYGDLLSRTLRAKDVQRAVVIPDRLNNLRVPVITVLHGTHDGWRWRMAARELMSQENVLALDKIRGLFNQFFEDGNKLLNKDTIGPLILHKDAKVRIFGVSATDYRRIAVPADQERTRKEATASMFDRYEVIFQRRHDCIHNCDRPKYVLQDLTFDQAGKAHQDISFLIERCHEALKVEFPKYLERVGFNAATRQRVLQ